VDIERELDDLYGLPLDEFTQARNALATRLRKEGERAAADEVKSLRKPSVAAWAANKLAREERPLVERFLEASDRVGSARGDDARAALTEHRDVLRELARAARGLAPSAADRVVETLRAAALDDEARDVLLRGRLSRELEAAGFPPPSDKVSQASERPGRDPRDELADRRRQREEEERQLRELRTRARDLERDADRAERDAERAQQEADRLQEEADEARERAEAAAEELRAAEERTRGRTSSGRTRRR
jgi:hypothetical protein